MMYNLTMASYIVASILFITSIRGLASPETARKGNALGATGMLLAIVTTFISPEVHSYMWIILAIIIGGVIGTYSALKVKMTGLPQMVAAFNGLGGLASVMVAMAEIVASEKGGVAEGALLESALGMVIGAVAFSGSIVAFAKLQGLMSGQPITFKFQQLLNLLLLVAIAILIGEFAMTGCIYTFYILAALSILVGFLLVIPIGGADMPVVISVLNAYSGFAGAGIGFTLHNSLLIITGSIVGPSGLILSYIMCKAMNRSLFNVIVGGFGGDSNAAAAGVTGDKNAKAGNADDAAFIMKNAQKVIIVPGYGMAVSQAQHVLKEMGDVLKKEGVEVKYAIHPVAGRMPGHMNVLLAEANVPYEDVFEMDEINREFATADVAYIIGANDVTNPLAKTDSSSPIFGMPILEVDKAKTVFFVKRSLSAGYAGVDNPLFYADNTMMLFADAKKMTEEIVKAMA